MDLDFMLDGFKLIQHSWFMEDNLKDISLQEFLNLNTQLVKLLIVP